MSCKKSTYMNHMSMNGHSSVEKISVDPVAFISGAFLILRETSNQMHIPKNPTQMTIQMNMITIFHVPFHEIPLHALTPSMHSSVLQS